MNQRDLRALFEDALASEPTNSPLADEDVARGRALRTRRLRRRVAGIGAGAMVATALTLPASPLSLVDGNGLAGIWAADGADDEWSADDIRRPRDLMVADDVGCAPATFCYWQEPATAGAIEGGLEEDMWQAVQEALPDDVRLVEGAEVTGYSYRAPTISFSVIHDSDDQNHVMDPVLTIDVMLQGSGAGDPQYRPCSEPDPQLREWPFADCSEGEDAEGRWRVVTSSPEQVVDHTRYVPKGLAVLDGEPASVTVMWEGDQRGAVLDEDATKNLDKSDEERHEERSAEGTLTDDDLDAIMQAVWAVGANSDAEELHTGIDLADILQDWPAVQATMEEQLDAGDLVPVEGDGITTEIDKQSQTGWISARYRTPDGIQVDLVVWQKARPYETFCHDLVRPCDVAPGTSTLRNDVDVPTDEWGSESEGLTAVGFGTLGQRAGMSITLHAESREPFTKVFEAGGLVLDGEHPHRTMDDLSMIFNSHDAILSTPNGS